MRASAGNWSARLTESISSMLGSVLQCVSDARRQGRSMRHAHSGTRLIVGEGRGGRLAVFGCSLLGVFLQVCRQFMFAAVLTHSTRRMGRSQKS